MIPNTLAIDARKLIDMANEFGSIVPVSLVKNPKTKTFKLKVGVVEL